MLIIHNPDGDRAELHESAEDQRPLVRHPDGDIRPQDVLSWNDCIWLALLFGAAILTVAYAPVVWSWLQRVL